MRLRFIDFTFSPYSSCATSDDCADLIKNRINNDKVFDKIYSHREKGLDTIPDLREN